MSSNETTTQITLKFKGKYSYVDISRDGTLIASDVSGATYTDTGLPPNTVYIYTLTPLNSTSDPGTEVLKLQKSTLPIITSFTVSNQTATQIVLAYSGSYTKVSITRNGTAITAATNLTGSTSYTDTGLIANNSYTYVITPKNSLGRTGTVATITKSTLPVLTSRSISSVTATQIVLAYSGSYTNVSISRNGTPIATNITGTTYTDVSGLTANTSYTYIITPYNSSGDAGTVVGTITKSTLPNITSTSVSSATETEIVLAYSGSYEKVSISRDGTTIATGITTATYTDSGLMGDTSYTYTVSPYNLDGIVGTVIGTITKSTLAFLTSLGIPSESTTENVLVFTGNYTNVSITREGTIIATGVTGTTYTDSGLTANNTFTYVVTPYNSSSDAGSTLSITKSTLPNITSLTIPIVSLTTTQIVLAFSGNYTNVSITRDGTAIATGVTTSTYTDVSGLTANTSYTYVVTPNNSTNTGSTSSITQSTLSSLTSVSVSSYTTSQIVLAISGNYTNFRIYRNGTILATDVTGTTYTDSSGLIVNTSYTYMVTSYNSSSNANYAGKISITQSTLPTLSAISVSSYTSSQIVLAYSGNYNNVSITSNGIAIATNITTASPYTDSSGIIGNTSYTYVVTPFNSTDNSGSTLSTTKITLPTLTSLSVSSLTDTQIVLSYPGNYTNVSITRNGSPIATNISGTTYTDVSGLTTNVSYTYIVTPYNSEGFAGSTLSITRVTLPILTTFTNNYTLSSSIRLYLQWTGTYSYVNITRDGTLVILTYE
jgi:hypothetical protein